MKLTHDQITDLISLVEDHSSFICNTGNKVRIAKDKELIATLKEMREDIEFHAWLEANEPEHRKMAKRMARQNLGDIETPAKKVLDNKRAEWKRSKDPTWKSECTEHPKHKTKG